MAEQSGVINTAGSSGGNTRPAALSGKKGKNRLLWIGGAVGGLFLLMAHKGGSSSAPTNAQNLQSASDALAAQEAAQANLANDTASFSPAGVPVDTGGGSYTQQGPSATTSPAVDLTINTAAPAGAGSGGATATPPPPSGTKPPAAPRGLPSGWKPLPSGPKKPAAPKGYVAVGLGSGAWGAKPAPKPKQPSKTKPAPASKKPNAKGSPQHPNTRKTTPSGARKHSPAEVESIDGFGSGITVLGRQFPGALSHRMGAPRMDSLGNICRDVTVDYGGHSETHTCHGNGRIWTDRTAGKNPPSRGVPVATDPIAI